MPVPSPFASGLALLALAVLTAATPAEARPAGPSCRAGAARIFARKADLPAGIESALGVAMAEAGAPFNWGDEITPATAHLPSYRFVSARQRGCRLLLDYEYGGIATGRETALLERRGGSWVLIRRGVPRR